MTDSDTAAALRRIEDELQEIKEKLSVIESDIRRSTDDIKNEVRSYGS